MLVSLVSLTLLVFVLALALCVQNQSNYRTRQEVNSARELVSSQRRLIARLEETAEIQEQNLATLRKIADLKDESLAKQAETIETLRSHFAYYQLRAIEEQPR